MSEEPYPYTWESNFRSRMKTRREQQGLTQTELAKRLKAYGLPFHQQTIQRVEAGDRPLRLDEAFAIAEVLGVELTDMVFASRETDVGYVRLLVSSLRRRSYTVGDDIDESMTDWNAEAWEPLAAEFLDVWNREQHRPTRLVRWIAAWLIKAIWMQDAALDAVMFSNGLSTDLDTWREVQPRTEMSGFQDLQWVADEEFWLSVPEPDRPTYLADLDPKALMAYIDADDDFDSSAEDTSDYGIDALPVQVLERESWSVDHEVPDRAFDRFTELVFAKGVGSADSLVEAVKAGFNRLLFDGEQFVPADASVDRQPDLVLELRGGRTITLYRGDAAQADFDAMFDDINKAGRLEYERIER